uniref:Sin3 histone deacetylase corepressor complex component SDS3 n=1 Tax=Anopheles dirus TaxID=7168 RepID=A0A182NAE2_9DIPT
MKMDGRPDAYDPDNDADSGEDTDEASESEMACSSGTHTVDERLEIKEQMYQDKLDNLLGQLELLKQRKQPEYLKAVERLQAELDDRLLLNECHRDYMLACAERDCQLEILAAEKEYEEKKLELKENIISDLEDQKKLIEHEFATMELGGDHIDVKPTVTRKLRRRPNEPLPVPEKRRKPTTGQITFLLDDKEVEHDLKLIARTKPLSGARSSSAQYAHNGGASGSGGPGGASTTAVPSQPTGAVSSVGSTSGGGTGGAGANSEQNGSTNSGATGGNSSSTITTTTNNNNNNTSASDTYATNSSVATGQGGSGGSQSGSGHGQHGQQTLADTRIEDGKLWYERRWFHRGQPVHVEGRDLQRFAANISAVGVEAICVKKTLDGQKVRIFLSHLRRGKISIKRRAN